MNLGKLTSDDLVILLNVYPQFEKLAEEVRILFRNNSAKLITPNSHNPSWYEFYEMPFNEHLAHIIVYTDQLESVKLLAAAENPTSAALSQIVKDLSDIDSELEEKVDEEDRAFVPVVMGLGMSLFLSFRCLLVFGVYLNDLLVTISKGGKAGDKALFQAIKIDPTVIACTNAIARVSQGVMENNTDFLRKLQLAMRGKLTKREDRTYQQQRLILQVLLEANTPQLTQEDLYELFVNQLNIVAKDRNTDIGDVANNLRQFSYQFMKQKSVSQN